ncbi:Tetratricopeptide repeat-containing protein [Quillaja saponaria]|uniref:Tetratricopeptide repeat-containing protein n=1 Tax=Quillaja saponaria TaxID=32244 RepID=A0AAD7Q5V8_QUISA|nr:Tetratricopeptide repeat-containing protein [Quillaja saponaria]
MKATLSFFHNSHSPCLLLLPNYYSLPISQSYPPLKRRRSGVQAEVQEIRVCTNRTCRRQGSFQTLETLSGLAPPNVDVKSCGCLGRCGAGPNIAFLPERIIVGHCGTAARAAQVMVGLFSASEGTDSDEVKKSLDALSLRKRAEIEFEKKNFDEAELLLSQAIELKPFGGFHIIYKCRSVVRLALGNNSGALEDAREALTLAPEYAEAYICEGNALVAMDQLDLAEKSYLTAIHIDPSIRHSKSFKVRITKLQDKLTTANIP